MESSDDSFAWTDASSTSEDSDENMSADMTKSIHESGSEKSFKKKLHKKLFKEHDHSEEKVKHELLNGDCIKPEPASDTEATPRKRKRKHKHDESARTSPEHDYLEMRVKQEDIPRNHQQPHEHTQHSNYKTTSEPDDKSFISQNGSNYIDRDDNEWNDTADVPDNKKKKKKSKKKKTYQEEYEDNEIKIEDKLTIEETIVGNGSMGIPRNGCNELETMTENDIVSEKTSTSKSKKEKKRKKVNDTSTVMVSATQNENEEEENHVADITTSNHNDHSFMTFDYDSNENVHQKNNLKSKASRRRQDSHQALNLSNQIQYEDEEGYETQKSDNNAVPQSSRLKRFLKTNPYLCPVSTNNISNSLISQDDDIWLLNCPHEIEATSLRGIDMSLDDKCKVKLDSQTYVGSIESETGRVAILMFKCNKPVITNVSLSGTINLRKRIPKAHFIQDNIIVNNQTDFIPLPDTKCRHPLFGPDYKKATKIPSSVKARLKISNVEVKHKKRKSYKIEMSEEHEADCGGDEPDAEERSERPPRGSRKRRHRDSAGAAGEPHGARKRLKRDTADAWDSEKAIEENLFNL